MSYTPTEDILEIFSEARRVEYLPSEGFTFFTPSDRHSLYHASIASGECVEVTCLDLAVPGKRRCHYHQAVRNRRQNARRSAVVASGVCVSCRAAVVSARNRWTCEECASTEAQRKRDARRARPRDQYCTRCHHRTPAAGRAECVQCRAHRAEWLRKWRAKQAMTEMSRPKSMKSFSNAVSI